jgi:hypothetical protein
MFGKENKSDAPVKDKKWEFFEEESSDNSDDSSMDVPPPPPHQQPPQPVPPPPPHQQPSQPIPPPPPQQQPSQPIPPPPPQQQPSQPFPPPPPSRMSTPVPFDEVDEEAPTRDTKEEMKDDIPNSFVPLTFPQNEEQEKVEVEEKEEWPQQNHTAHVIDQEPKQIEAADISSTHSEDVVQERKMKKRGTLIAAAIFGGLCLLAGLAIGVSRKSWQENDGEVPSASASTDPPTTNCTSWVEPSLPCYNTNHTFIQISFEMCNPLPEDYVGIYRFSDEFDPEDLGNPTMWIWSCGRIDLDDCIDGILVYSVTNLTLKGRLSEGIYQVHLSHRNPGGPFTSEGASRPFNVSGEC